MHATTRNTNGFIHSYLGSALHFLILTSFLLQPQKSKKPSEPRRCPATSSNNRISRSRCSREKGTGKEGEEREDFVDVEGGEEDSEALGPGGITHYVPDTYGESSDSSEDASWSPRNYFGYRGHLGIEFFTDNSMTAYPRNPFGINALQKRTMNSGRNTIRF
ncbi:unnamed protein product [Dibothriocephalus latus]|uniref:Uncharacterized protein n=1 Tax=Dibothriocephalus latus TaxID=60516 RepID=A0A3P7N858_DIBLA|nr:unnamed protein product [Dibothriocephalus latus]